MTGRNVQVYLNTPNPVEVLGMDATELYRTQPALRAVVSFLADNVAGLPLKAYIRESDNNRPRDTQSALAQLILKPSTYMTMHEIIRATASDYFLHGNALWFVVPSTENEAGFEIYVIPWQWIDKDPTEDGLQPVEYTFTNPHTGKTVTIDAEDCIRFYGYDPEGVNSASSPVEALKQVLSEQISAWNFRNSTWKNGGRISAWLFRPKDAPPWGDGGRERFAESWKAKFAGNEGTNTGGTPLLEDGMELRTTTFNAREAQWAEATKLTREDVSAVFHVNPSLIWHTDGQTYASAKDNARALYADTLAPLLDMLEERINTFLVPRLGVDSRTYVAFDLSAKLAGSFEERASILQSSVGGPWLTRNEVRAMNDMPSIEGGDELIVPLNVTEGGLASPNDTDNTIERYSAVPLLKAAPKKASGTAEDEDADEIAEIVLRFLNRQGRSVLQSLDKKGRTKAGEYEDWWDAERWTSELTDDLFPAFLRQSRRKARRTLADLGISEAGYDVERTEAYIRSMAERRAEAVNDTTYRKLTASLDGDYEDEAVQSTPEGVYELSEERSSMYGITFATAVAAWASMEAVRQSGTSGATKTWVVNSGNPRPSHAAMNGETVPIDETFSNGAEWPGDSSALDVADVANCQCSVDIVIP